MRAFNLYKNLGLKLLLFRILQKFQVYYFSKQKEVIEHYEGRKACNQED